MRKKVISIFHFNRQVFAEYVADNVLKYSASLAYYTTLSIAPMLIIVIAVSGILFGRNAMEGEVYNELQGLMGSQGAAHIQDIIKNIHLNRETPVATILSVVILLFGATGIFGEMQDSLNKIWGLKTTNYRIWWKILLDRLISFSIIISLGFVMVVSLALNAVATALSNRIDIFFGAGGRILAVTDMVVATGITTLMFACIFKILPDAHIKWKDVMIGALITAVLFMLGRFAIGLYLGQSNLASLFGAAGSLIVVMLWVYYSSATLYLGAVFTKVYAMNFGGKIRPNEYATWIKVSEIPVAKATLHEVK